MHRATRKSFPSVRVESMFSGARQMWLNPVCLSPCLMTVALDESHSGPHSPLPPPEEGIIFLSQGSSEDKKSVAGT